MSRAYVKTFLFVPIMLLMSSCLLEQKKEKNDFGDKLIQMKFNELNGTTATNDMSEHFNGVISMASRLDGIEGKALNFANSGAKVTISPPYFQNLTTENFVFPTSEITVMAWIRVSSYDTEVIDPIVWNWVNSYRLQLNNGNLEFLLGNNGVWTSVVKDANTLPVNQWIHVAVTYDGNEAVTYINGVPTNSALLISSIPTEANETYIGGTRDGVSFSGDIDEVNLWRKKLSAAEILGYYSTFL